MWHKQPITSKARDGTIETELQNHFIEMDIQVPHPLLGKVDFGYFKTKKEPRIIPRILLVDDDPLFGKIMKVVARLDNVPLTFCKTSKEINKLGHWNFDILLLDYDLGNITGCQLAQFVEKYGKPVPIVMVSEYGNLDVKEWPHLVHDFLHKSMGPRGILNATIEIYNAWSRGWRNKLYRHYQRKH